MKLRLRGEEPEIPIYFYFGRETSYLGLMMIVFGTVGLKVYEPILFCDRRR